MKHPRLLLVMAGLMMTFVASCNEREPNPALLGDWVMPDTFPGIVSFNGLQAVIHPRAGCHFSHCTRLTKTVDYELEVVGAEYHITFADDAVFSGTEGWTAETVDEETRPSKLDQLILTKKDACTFVDNSTGRKLQATSTNCPAIPLNFGSIGAQYNVVIRPLTEDEMALEVEKGAPYPDRGNGPGFVTGSDDLIRIGSDLQSRYALEGIPNVAGLVVLTQDHDFDVPVGVPLRIHGHMFSHGSRVFSLKMHGMVDPGEGSDALIKHYLTSFEQRTGWTIHTGHFGQEKLEVEIVNPDIPNPPGCGTAFAIGTEIPTLNHQARKLVIHGFSERASAQMRPCE